MSSKPRAKSSSGHKSLGDLMRKSAAEAAPVPRKLVVADQPPLVVRSISLTPAASSALDNLIASGSGQTGRKVSASAVVRALLRMVENQPQLSEAVMAQVQAEINSGEVVWGKESRAK